MLVHSPFSSSEPKGLSSKSQVINEMNIVKNQYTLYQTLRRLFVLGGGGRRGIEATPDVVEDEDEAEFPSRLLPGFGFGRPGIEIEKVCPSFRL